MKEIHNCNRQLKFKEYITLITYSMEYIFKRDGSHRVSCVFNTNCWYATSNANPRCTLHVVLKCTFWWVAKLVPNVANSTPYYFQVVDGGDVFFNVAVSMKMISTNLLTVRKTKGLNEGTTARQ